MDAGEVAGTGPDGAATLADVLRQAGRPPPAAARPPRPRTVRGAGGEGEGEGLPGRMEAACDAKPVRDACRALAVLSAAPPEPFDLVARLARTALRDHPRLARAFVVRPPDAPGAGPGPGPEGVGPEGAGREETRPPEAALTIAERTGSILLGLEFAAGSEREGEAFLERLRALCLDPRRALL